MALWDIVLKDEQIPSWVKNTVFGAPAVSFERTELSQSVIAAGLTIEGKIEGAGSLRIAGRFKGDVRVDGALTFEPGAYISGVIQADEVLVKGEVEGNILACSHVVLSESGVIIGDVKAPSLSVAAGSRMRGNVEFGWGKEESEKVISLQCTESAL